MRSVRSSFHLHKLAAYPKNRAGKQTRHIKKILPHIILSLCALTLVVYRVERAQKMNLLNIYVLDETAKHENNS
jgi:hypothetical protein